MIILEDKISRTCGVDSPEIQKKIRAMVSQWTTK